MDYKKALEYLDALEEWRMRPGLDITREILRHLPRVVSSGADFGEIPFIQVAGTNGKGSTSHFLTSILQTAGHKVGLFTSPHLQDVRERITVNKQWISKKDFANSLGAVKELAEGLLKKELIYNMPTYFECTFLTAIHYFLKQEVSAAILEVGLGGRLDATSTITPDVSVITNIARDHTAVLGSRLRDIAAEKAGIIKKGVPVVCGCSVRTISHRVIKAIALQNNAPFFNVIDAKNRLETIDRENFYRCTYTTAAAAGNGSFAFDIRLNGVHQAYNAACAIKTIQVLNHSPGNKTPVISKKSVCKGISSSSIPARIEILDTSPPVILDGGHNVQSTTALTNFLAEKKKNNLTLVFGVLADKNYRRMIALLLPYIRNVILTEPASIRALPSRKLAGFFYRRAAKTIFVKIINNPEEAYSAARQFKKEILVTGSFYLVGAIRKMIKHNIIPGG